MKKSLIALLLLFGFIGCDQSHAPATVQNEAGNGRTADSAGGRDVMDTETTAERLSTVLGQLSLGTRIEQTEPSVETPELETSTEPEKPEAVVDSEAPDRIVEAVSWTPIRYISEKDGFRVLMPSTPTVMNLKAANNTHVRVYQTRLQDGLVVYNVFCHYFEIKKLSGESIRSYLDSSLPDRLVGIDKGQVIRKTLTQFRGFDAKEFEHVSVAGDTEFVYRGVVFVIDGDSISLTMVYPAGTEPELTFAEFSESFELLPVEPVLSSSVWVDEDLGLRFTPPGDMSQLTEERGHNGLIVMFANEAGHTIGILDATIAYPGITWSDIQTRLSEMKDCGDGFYENVITARTTKIPTVQLLRCVGDDERIYLIQAYAPQKTYFRYVQQFKAAMTTFSFNR